MKIGIIGSRGIPNHHGGFEQFAEYFSVFLAQKGEEVFVYNSSLHPYKKENFKGVKIIHCKDPEDKLGTAGQFIYDFNCIVDARKRNFDIILQLGYTSSSVWYFLMPKNAVVVTNMDGLEWMRTKYGNLTKKFLKLAESLAANKSDFLISDSVGIKTYLSNKYGKKSEFIAYGAHLFHHPDNSVLQKYNLNKSEYNLLIARIEPENNIETILDGVKNYKHPTLVVGDASKTDLGKRLLIKYANNEKIIFLGAIYNTETLNSLRHYSYAYFHGHSVGGTNPSLLEAMASNAFIVAHNNIFNQSVLGKDALYFTSSEDISVLLKTITPEFYKQAVLNNRNKIAEKYSWETINNKYLNYFKQLLDAHN